MRIKVLPVSKRLSATAICRRPPSPFVLSPQFTSVKYQTWPPKDPDCVKFPRKSSGSTKEEKIDRFFRAMSLIDPRRLVEKKLGFLLHKWTTIKNVYLQVFSNRMKGISNYLLADKLNTLSPDVISSCKIVAAYNRMRNVDNKLPDRFTLALLLRSFTSFDQLENVKTVHGQVIKLGFVPDTIVMNSLLDFYFKFVGEHVGLRVVRKVFEEMPTREIVSWNVMISGLVGNSFCYEALLVFNDMLLAADHQRCKPNETTLINMVNACSEARYIEQGNRLYTYIKENKFELSLPLGNALIGMFVNFSDLGNAKMLFKSMSKRCLITWETMMRGLVENGFCEEVLVLFDTMCCCSEVEEGDLNLNDDIFLLVLTAFRGDERLLGDLKRLFGVIHKFVHVCGVKPNRQHYDFMVMILAEAGWVEAAMMLTESLPWEPDNWIWAHVLYACQIHGNDDDLLLDSLLLDSWLQKIRDVNSKQGPSLFLKLTIKSYMNIVFTQNHNNHMCYATYKVDRLLRLLCYYVPSDLRVLYELGDNLEDLVKQYSIPDEGPCNYSAVHAQETLPLHKVDAYKSVESLDRQLLDFHDQMINIIEEPFGIVC